MVRVIERQRDGVHPSWPFDLECFVLHLNAAPLSFVEILRAVFRVELLFVDIADVRLVPRYRPRDFVVETCKEKRAAEPADAARIQLAGSKQVGFVLLKAI